MRKEHLGQEYSDTGVAAPGGTWFEKLRRNENVVKVMGAFAAFGIVLGGLNVVSDKIEELNEAHTETNCQKFNVKLRGASEHPGSVLVSPEDSQEIQDFLDEQPGGFDISGIGGVGHPAPKKDLTMGDEAVVKICVESSPLSGADLVASFSRLDRKSINAIAEETN